MSQDILQVMKANQSTRTGADKRPYLLDEVLAIIVMLGAGKKVSEVAAITGRSAPSLRYKFIEKSCTLNGKETVRSIKRFNSVEEIFAHYKVEYKGEEDVKERVENYMRSLIEKVNAVDQAS